MLLYANIENHIAMWPDLLMAVGTPGRRHSFFPCNLKSNKSRLIILVQQAYHLDSTFRSNPVKLSLSSSFLLQKVKATRKNIPDFIIWNFSMPLPGDHWKWSGNYRLVRLLLVKNNDANLLGPTVIDLLSCSRLKTSWLYISYHARGPHLQHNEHVQLQRLILQRQGEVECHYNVLPGLSPITTWYKVTIRDAA